MLCIMLSAAISGVAQSKSGWLDRFPGGADSLLRFVQGHLVYPDTARALSREGKVIVSFHVKTDGTLSDVKVTKHSHRLLDAEVLRVMGTVPRCRVGPPDTITYRIPVVFMLRRDL